MLIGAMLCEANNDQRLNFVLQPSHQACRSHACWLQVLVVNDFACWWIAPSTCQPGQQT